MKTLYGLFGAGGFGREVMSPAYEMLALLYDIREFELVFVVEDLAEETALNGHRVISEAAFLAHDVDQKQFNIAIADATVRERIATKMAAAGIEPFTIQAPNVVCYEHNDIDVGAILCAFTTVTANAKIGKFFHGNIYSYVAHDCVIGDFVTFAPSVHCNGRVVVEDYAYIGTGAVLRQGTDSKPLVIGKGATVGMGAVVTKSVPPFTTVVGNPAAEFRKQS
jgi:sugar O-acyltransferase (sialic acid O-acetyltransferase NeuD family)